MCRRTCIDRGGSCSWLYITVHVQELRVDSKSGGGTRKASIIGGGELWAVTFVHRVLYLHNIWVPRVEIWTVRQRRLPFTRWTGLARSSVGNPEIGSWGREIRWLRRMRLWLVNRPGSRDTVAPPCRGGLGRERRSSYRERRGHSGGWVVLAASRRRSRTCSRRTFRGRRGWGRLECRIDFGDDRVGMSWRGRCTGLGRCHWRFGFLGLQRSGVTDRLSCRRVKRK